MSTKRTERLKVVELFAGVGGFRVGLERASDAFEVVWSNQWEPSTKRQDASAIYVARFGGEGHSNKDLATVPTAAIPDHDLLVGGFPCQDYSVARTANQAAGLQGKKGVLWWEIHRILKEKAPRPGYILLENVDRLLKSPAQQRGRDFAVMLASLSDLGYVVEWRVINAADYGMPQRRRRVFFLAYHRSTAMGRSLLAAKQPADRILRDGVLAEAFPLASPRIPPAHSTLTGDLAEITTDFNTGKQAGTSPFHKVGLMADRQIWTVDAHPAYTGPHTTLGQVLLPTDAVPGNFFLDPESVEQWKYLKGHKRETRTARATGHTYTYSEGNMVFPDALDAPSRTIVTGEGGAAPSRFKHVVRTADGRLRRLTPVELERLNMFPDNHTAGASDSRRAFLMGNALVVGIITRIATALASHIGAPSQDGSRSSAVEAG